MVRVRTECCHGFTALTLVLVIDSRRVATGRLHGATFERRTHSVNSLGTREILRSLQPTPEPS